MNYQFSLSFLCVVVVVLLLLYAGVTVKIVMASHNYKLYLYFIIARASRALSNIASDYAVNKLRKYDFLPGQSACLPHFLLFPLFFPSYFSSSSFRSLPSLVCLILLLLLLATLELCSSWRHFRARWRAPLLLCC